MVILGSAKSIAAVKARKVAPTRFVLLFLLSLALVAIRPLQVWAAPPHCWPYPYAVGSIRLLQPNLHEQQPSNDIEVIIAVPPSENVAVAQIFSADAQSGSGLTPLWLSLPVPLAGVSHVTGLKNWESAWSFRIFGAAPHSVVSLFAAHFEYGTTVADPPNPFSLSTSPPAYNPSNSCRLLVQHRLGTFMTR